MKRGSPPGDRGEGRLQATGGEGRLQATGTIANQAYPQVTGQQAGHRSADVARVLRRRFGTRPAVQAASQGSRPPSLPALDFEHQRRAAGEPYGATTG